MTQKGKWKLEKPKVCMAVHRLAEHYRTTGKYDQSESILKSMLHTERRMLNPNDLKISGFLSDLGTIRMCKKDHTGAAGLFKESMDLSAKKLGPSNPMQTVPLSNLGEMARKQGHHKKAARLLQESINISEHNAVHHKQTTDHRDVIFSYGALAKTFKSMGNHRLSEENRARSICKDLGVPPPARGGLGFKMPEDPHPATAYENDDFIRARNPFLPTEKQVARVRRGQLKVDKKLGRQLERLQKPRLEDVQFQKIMAAGKDRTQRKDEAEAARHLFAGRRQAVEDKRLAKLRRAEAKRLAARARFIHKTLKDYVAGGEYRRRKMEDFLKEDQVLLSLGVLDNDEDQLKQLIALDSEFVWELDPYGVMIVRFADKSDRLKQEALQKNREASREEGGVTRAERNIGGGAGGDGDGDSDKDSDGDGCAGGGGGGGGGGRDGGGDGGGA
jgi:tetratricopeptide (TPR) repeat protein